MSDIIELAIVTTEGTIDCRIEHEEHQEAVKYAATILYPTKLGGYSRSDIFCHNLVYNDSTGIYIFEDSGDLHPKIKALEAQLSAAIANNEK